MLEWVATSFDPEFEPSSLAWEVDSLPLSHRHRPTSSPLAPEISAWKGAVHPLAAGAGLKGLSQACHCLQHSEQPPFTGTLAKAHQDAMTTPGGERGTHGSRGTKDGPSHVCVNLLLKQQLKSKRNKRISLNPRPQDVLLKMERG